MLTYEGDNNVILLQASNYLVGLFDDKQKGACAIVRGKACGFGMKFESLQGFF